MRLPFGGVAQEEDTTNLYATYHIYIRLYTPHTTSIYVYSRERYHKFTRMQMCYAEVYKLWHVPLEYKDVPTAYKDVAYRDVVSFS